LGKFQSWLQASHHGNLTSSSTSSKNQKVRIAMLEQGSLKNHFWTQPIVLLFEKNQRNTISLGLMVDLQHFKICGFWYVSNHLCFSLLLSIFWHFVASFGNSSHCLIVIIVSYNNFG
jgi:hypothetical protein